MARSNSLKQPDLLQTSTMKKKRDIALFAYIFSNKTKKKQRDLENVMLAMENSFIRGDEFELWSPTKKQLKYCIG